MADEDGFLARWSRRKTVRREGGALPAEPPRREQPAAAKTVPAQPPQEAGPGAAASNHVTGVAGSNSVTGAAAAHGLPAAEGPAHADAEAAPAAVGSAVGSAVAPAPTLDDVARLDRGADFSRFVARGVESPVRNAALRKLFSDPHFNVMDGLDTYIDDYGKPDPLPLHLLRQMTQSRALGLFEDEERADEQAPADAAAAPPTLPEPLRDENADLRLQPDDAAGPGDAGAHEPGAGEDAAGQR